MPVGTGAPAGCTGIIVGPWPTSTRLPPADGTEELRRFAGCEARFAGKACRPKLNSRRGDTVDHAEGAAGGSFPRVISIQVPDNKSASRWGCNLFLRSRRWRICMSYRRDMRSLHWWPGGSETSHEAGTHQEPIFRVFAV